MYVRLYLMLQYLITTSYLEITIDYEKLETTSRILH